MYHYVYMLISVNRVNLITYVGYSINPNKRLKLHNLGKGAKFTKGRKWKIIFKKKFNVSKEVYLPFRLKVPDLNLIYICHIKKDNH